MKVRVLLTSLPWIGLVGVAAMLFQGGCFQAAPAIRSANAVDPQETKPQSGALAPPAAGKSANNTPGPVDPTPVAGPEQWDHEDLDATLWMRTAAEYHVLVTDAYARAWRAVELGVGDPNASALPSQAARLGETTADDEPWLPAVILDVDETVLDNSGYQVESLNREPYQFSDETWNQWCLREAATPLPGVAGFLEKCREKGVAIRFLTNRSSEVRAATLSNLRKFGLVPVDGNAEAELLCKGDREDWGSDKTSRREFVASQFRIVAMIGDDLNDFLWVGDKATPAQRTAAAMAADAMWGSRWFLLPNANYGGWEKAVQEYRFPLSRLQALELKRKALEAAPTVPVQEVGR